MWTKDGTKNNKPMIKVQQHRTSYPRKCINAKMTSATSGLIHLQTAGEMDAFTLKIFTRKPVALICNGIYFKWGAP